MSTKSNIARVLIAVALMAATLVPLMFKVVAVTAVSVNEVFATTDDA